MQGAELQYFAAPGDGQPRGYFDLQDSSMETRPMHKKLTIRAITYDVELKPEDVSAFDLWTAAVGGAISRATAHVADDDYKQYEAHTAVSSMSSRPLVYKLMSYDVSEDCTEWTLLPSCTVLLAQHHATRQLC